MKNEVEELKRRIEKLEAERSVLAEARRIHQEILELRCDVHRVARGLNLRPR